MTRRAWLLMGALAALWGSNFMFVELALRDGLGVPSIVFVRVLLAGIVLLPFALRRRALVGVKACRGWMTAIAALQIAVPFALIAVGQHWVASGLAAVLVASTPLFVALLSPWLMRADAPRGWAIVGVMMGLAGVALLFGIDLSGDWLLLLGGAMMLLAAFCYALSSFWLRTKVGAVNPVGVATATMLIASVMSLPAALADVPGSTPGLGTIAALVVLGAGGTGIAVGIYFSLIVDVGVNRAAVAAYLAPAFSVVYGVLLLGEPLSAAIVGGLALILAGSWLSAEGRAPWQPRIPGAIGAAREVAFEPPAEDLLAGRAWEGAARSQEP